MDFIGNRRSANFAFQQESGKVIQSQRFHDFFFTEKTNIALNVFIGANATIGCIAQSHDGNRYTIDFNDGA